MAKMTLDFSESKRAIAPEGEYQLRCKEFFKKNSKAGKPMLEIHWIPFDPPAGVTMAEIEKVVLRDWVSLAPNALFSLKNLMHACGVECECADCSNMYSAKLEACDRCQSAVFKCDDDFINSAEPRAFVIVKKDQNNENDVNEVKTYIAAS